MSHRRRPDPRLTLVSTQPLVKNLSKQHVLSDGLPVYRRLQSDDQDSVRLLTVEDLIVIAQQLTPSEVKEQLLKQIRHSVADKSWRVRYMAATHFNEVGHNQNAVVTSNDKLFYSLPRRLAQSWFEKN